MCFKLEFKDVFLGICKLFFRTKSKFLIFFSIIIKKNHRFCNIQMTFQMRHVIKISCQC